MRRFFRAAAALALALTTALGFVPPADAQVTRSFTTRYSNNLNGEIKLIGNMQLTCSPTGTNGASCANARAGSGGLLSNNDFTMVNVDADADATTFNSSSASLNLPSGSVIRFAGLYWGATSASTQRNRVLLRTPGAFGYTSIVASAVDTAAGQASNYGAFADVTSLVASAGNGEYFLANMQAITNAAGIWGGWSLVVVYENNTLPLRNLTVFDGYGLVNGSPGVVINVSGFLTPLSGPVVTRLGAVGYDGDRSLTGDTFSVNGTAISDANNPANNFYNSTVSDLGVSVTSRNPSYNNTLGVEVDSYTVPTGVVTNGATSATLQLTTGGENYHPHAVTFTTDLYVPIVTPNMTKTVTDLNGGSVLAGDTLRWTISMSNTGQDSATNLILSDDIPANMTYVPGSLRVVSGANAGVKTDGSGDDQGEYIASGTPRIVFRLGSGANAVNGGTLAYGQSTSVSFDTAVNPVVPAGTSLSNSATISYRGQTLATTTFSGTSSTTSATVLGASTITKSFAPASIAPNGTAVLSITVANPASNPSALTGVAFSDTYPAGLVNTATPNATVSCTPGSTVGTITGGAAGGNSIGMTPGATIAANGSCTVTVNVTAAAGSYTNVTGAVTSTNGGTGTTATATLAVGRIAIAKSFSPTAIEAGTGAGGPFSTLTLTLTNPNPSALSAVAFSDTYPSGLVNHTAAPSVSNTCGGTVTANAGTGSLTLAGGILAASGNCSITVQMQSASGNVYNNQASGATHSTDATPGNPSNVATLTVVGAPTVTKTFAPTTIGINGVSLLSISITNPNSATTITRSGVVFLDVYPVGLLNTNPASVTLNCSAGSSIALTAATGASGGNTLGLSDATLLPNGSCTVTSNVTSAAAGTYNNPLAPTTLTFDNAPDPALPTAVLVISNLAAPTIAKSFALTAIPINGTSTLTVTLTNANVAAITGASFTDNFPFGLIVAATPSVTNTCGGSITGGTSGASSIGLTGGTIPASGSCALSVSVTSASAGQRFNSTGSVTSANAPPSGSANATLNVLAAPTITKSFGTNPVATNTNSLLTIVVSNPAINTLSITGASFTDNYPAGVPSGLLVNNTAPAILCTAGSSGTVTGASGGSSVGMTAGTLAVGGSCTITVNVRSASTAAFANSTGNVTSTNAGTGSPATATLQVGGIGIAKAFAPSAIVPGGTSTITFTLSNATGVARTGLNFTDTLVNMQLASATVGGTCTGVVSNAAAGVTAFQVTNGNVPTAGCTITVSVTSSSPGSNPNTTSAAAATGVPAGNPSNTANLTVTPPPDVSKSFTPSQIAANATSVLTVTLFNPNASAVTGVTFTDSYPAGLVNAATPSVATNCGGAPTLTAAAGGALVTMGGSGGTIPANSSCTLTVNVTAASTADYVNTIPIGGVSSSGGSNLAAASATLTVLAPPVVSKTFSPSQISVAGTSLLTITLTNSNTIAITGVGFTDTYPAGIINSAAPGAGTSCSGTLSAAAGGGSVALASGTIAANGSCTVTVNVTAGVAGSYTNTIAAGGVTSSNAGSNTAAASAALSVGRPFIAKAFSPNPILPAGTSVLTFTLSNGTASAMTGVAFGDTYPAGLLNHTTPAVTNTCGGSTTGGASGGNTIGLTGGTIPANGSCTVSVTVSAAASGVYNNVSGAVTSVSHGAGNTAAAALTVMAPPTVAKTFSPSTVAIGTPSVLTLTLTNPNAFAITAAAFSDAYPAGLINTTTPAGSTTCTGGTVTAASAGTSLVLGGGTIPAGGSCSVTANVQANAAGSYANSFPIGALTSSNAPANTAAANATLTVLAPPTVAKSFAPATIGTGGNSVLTIALTNPNAAAAITGAAFSDTYPAGLINAAGATTSIVGAGCTGTLTATPGGNSFALTGGTLPASTTCQFRVTNVTANASGSYFNQSGTVTTTNAGSGTNATATLTVIAPLLVTKSFNPPFVSGSGTSQLTLTMINPNAVALTGVTINDVYDSNQINNVNPPLPTLTGAGCLGTITANDNASSMTFAGGTVPANSTCVIQVTIDVQGGGTGDRDNCTDSISTVEAGTSPNVCASINKGDSTSVPPSIAKAFAPNPMQVNGTSTLTFTITNNSTTAVGALAFTDAFPIGVVVATPLTTSNNCGGTLQDDGGGALAASDAGIQLTGGAIAGVSPATCTVTVAVTAAAVGIYNNLTSVISSDDGNGNQAAASLTVIAAPTIAKAFAPSAISTGAITTMTLTLTNPNTGLLTGLRFDDPLTNITVAAPLTVGGTCANVTHTAVAGGNTFNVTGGDIPASGSCTITVAVTSSAAGSHTNTTTGVITTQTPLAGAASNTATLTVTSAGVAVSGSVYRDTNTNGSKEAAEDWSASPSVFVNLVSGVTVVQSVTVPAGSGAYAFSNVPPGNYTIVVTNSAINASAVAPAGSSFVVPATGLIAATVGGTPSLLHNFGLIGGSRITGRVFRDTGVGAGTANDGVQNGTEPGIANVTMTLTNCAATTYATTITDGTGSYTIPIGASGPFCVVEATPSGFRSTGTSVATTALPSGTATPVGGTTYTYTRAAPNDSISFTGVAGTDYLNLNFGDVPEATFVPDGVLAGLPGTVLFYPHNFVAGSVGDVTFSTTAVATPSNLGWGETIFNDVNCNGQFDSGEPQITAAINVVAGQTVCVLLREFIPANAANGAQNAVTLNATVNFLNANSGLSATYTRVDLTTVGPPAAAGLRLVKAVNQTSALPGATIVYTITYTNLSSEPLANIIVRDAVPTYTQAPVACCINPGGSCLGTPATPFPTAISACVANVGGATPGSSITWPLTGTLLPGQSGSVKFSVQVQP